MVPGGLVRGFRENGTVLVPGTISRNSWSLFNCIDRVCFNRRVYWPGFVDDQKRTMMQEAMLILFKQMFPECANDDIKVMESLDIKGYRFFYAMAGGKKVKCFADYMQVLQKVGKEEKVLFELKITQIFAMANVYHDGINFLP
jgi:hypothetical protein